MKHPATDNKPGAGYIYGPHTPYVLNSSVYAQGQTYPPHLQQIENPIAYQLLGEWNTINTTRSTLLTDGENLNTRDSTLYSEGVEIDKTATALNQERDKLNAEIDAYNKKCAGQPVNAYCTNWYNKLAAWQKDWTSRVTAHNKHVEDWRGRVKALSSSSTSWLDRVKSWEQQISNFIENAKTLLSYHGNCTPEEHFQLQQAVKAACSPAIIRACVKGQDCDTLKQNLKNFMACHDARVTINNRCFDGGDPGHQEQAQIMLNGANNCIQIIKEDCGGRLWPTLYEQRTVRFDI